MPRSSATVAAQTGRQILDSATELFTSRGFAGVSLAAVAETSGVTRGAVYHHFRNKTGLFRAVAARLQAGVADTVVEAADGAGPDPGDQLRAGSHAFLDAITAPSAVRILLIDGPSVIGWQEWRRLDAENSARHLRDALGNAGVSQESLDATSALLSGAMNEAALWITEQPDTAAARKQSHAALDRLLGSVLPSSP